MKHRRILALVTLALAGGLLFPTMAAPLTGSTDTIEQTEVVLEPYPGPNGKYAVMKNQDADSDLELALNFSASNPDVEGEGVNAGSITAIDRVFTLTYTGDQTAKVYLTDGVEEVTFYRDNEPGRSLEGKSNAVVLSPERQTIAVGVKIDARDGTAVESIDDFTVHVSDTTTATETPTEDGGGGGGGDGGEPDTPTTETPGDDDDDTPTTETDTPSTDGDDTTTETDTLTTEPDTPVTTAGTGTETGEPTTTTTNAPQAGGPTTTTPGGPTTTTPAGAADPGASNDPSLPLGGLPWWVILLALLVAGAGAGTWYYTSGP